MVESVTIGNNVTLYCGDCREILPYVLDIDVVVTDPPYGLDFEYGMYQDSRANLQELISDIMPLVRQADRVCIIPGITQVHLYPEPDWMGCITWDTTGSFGKYGYTQWMPLLLYGHDVAGFGRNSSGALKSDLIKSINGAVGFQRDKDGSQTHPCPKPENVMRSIVARYSDEGDTILDPFMGSGTTGVVAAKLGRKFVGIELEPRHFDTSCKRIEQAMRQPDMFVEKRPAWEQATLALPE